MKSIVIAAIAFSSLAAPSLSAQTLSGALSNVSLPLPLITAAVGNGVQQSAPIITVTPSTPALIGVGALSGNPDHYGSLLSISLLNSARLVGVNGVGGLASGLVVSVPNPRNAPVLSPVK